MLFLSLIGHPTEAVTIYVKVMVDEEEPGVERLWQKRLKDRVDAASDIINEYCDIRFSVSEFGTWQSDNHINDLNRSLREFEQEVEPKSGQIAIGFSSQFKFRKGRNGLGGTRGPLHSHVLLRESSKQIREPERLEALVHELGHFLGAAHSGSSTSAMRPVIGDGQARARSFRIGYDPINAKIVQLVGSEVNVLGVRRFQNLSDTTKMRIRDGYVRLAKELPKDPAAPHFIRYIDQSRSVQRAPVQSSPNGAKRAPLK
ncbi:MAG: hypothetical protein P8N76_01610 [Pirellulaceae bacterium]|nr:hypothetical protein [Pirellulaceae bacterium]